MLDFFYNILIYPIELIIEFLFVASEKVFKNNSGISILIVSLAVSIGCLPLYAIAEKLQQKERNIQNKMKDKITSIKKNFSGDEQYMILSTYYRQNNYHPLYALRSSFSLLIQVPFFIAAFSFLSHLGAIEGKLYQEM